MGHQTPGEFSARAEEHEGPEGHWVTIGGNHVLIHEPHGKQPGQRQTVVLPPFHPRLIYDKNLSAKNQALANEKLEAVQGLINTKWSQLTDEEKPLLRNIEAIYVDPSARRPFVSEDTRQLTLTPDFIATSSVPWIASSIVHDGYHVLQYKLGGKQNSRGLQAEVAAMKIELEAGKKFGLSKTEENQLESYIKNPSHLEKYINTSPH